MREILGNRLWIGNAGDGRDPERLLRDGVATVINLAAEEPSPVLPRSLVYCHFPIMDGAQGTKNFGNSRALRPAGAERAFRDGAPAAVCSEVGL